MPRKSAWCFGLGLVSMAVLCAAPLIEKQDRTWKLYTNAQWGYCVSYPSRWLKGDAFDGAGIYVKTGLKKYSKALGEIDVGVLPDEAEPVARATPVSLVRHSLVEDLEMHFDGLKRFERAESIEILEKREMQIVGSSALFTKDRYYDPQERATWLEEIIFTHHNGALYRLELECRDDQLPRFEPVFQTFVRTFRFGC
ncbi:MAG: hypothetical protein JO340_12565 [Acidobacteriaceae bacterium]|nr:hypothetical protein [Acidobacteriaceae bacterium]